MEEAETVPADTNIVAEAHEEIADVKPLDIEDTEEKVPLFALQKERKRRQEAELKAQWLEENQQKAQQSRQPEEDDSFESLTKGEYRKSAEATELDIIRKIEERQWVKNNAEKFEIINDRLPNLLKMKPNLAYAIANSTNRYEDAWDMLTAFDKEQQRPEAKRPNLDRRNAPGSPSGVPKSAAINEAVDVMSMSDKEFAEWRASKKKRR